MATRHRIMVPLNLSDLFWKPLVGLPNDRKDLGAVDTMLMRELHDLECLGDAEVEALDPDEVVEYLLRVTQAPRNPHMDKMNTLTVPTLAQLVDDSVALKLDAIRLQLVSFMEGMAAVLPYALCTLFTPAQFEELVCGSPDIDIDMLQRITVYEGVDATAPHIGFFWQCLQDMNQAQRSLFVNFVLARSRLPRVQLLLPFLDFHGQHLLESPISRTANRLTHLRHLIFKRHKIKFWRDMVDFTTTHTTPPSDEYERPDSLREVSVNRIVALDEPVSFATSVFGQLHEAMQAWDNHSLRRAYADELQDAGQRRAFYVKFLGEGVDDHGGPYRAVFQTGAWDEPSGGLQYVATVG
ncbi:hypothetical protein H257_05037 [Aphanomyces astaci]|uniref:HECT domain-containing protein n=1 Tax=Aphanomyces astaci TaxID=112090 RepID=W4GRM9_APHAT|nr:hypothetical protein H257_05037 [Aphanomyces astaci]ETV82385.1 hypothetical protein H257_05037 [Aphanomyces astaci]|eukprot:XP_009828054.1 hypothetical protein H257_05037 [Aphanomyces astaci]